RGVLQTQEVESPLLERVDLAVQPADRVPQEAHPPSGIVLVLRAPEGVLRPSVLADLRRDVAQRAHLRVEQPGSHVDLEAEALRRAVRAPVRPAEIALLLRGGDEPDLLEGPEVLHDGLLADAELPR